MNLKISRTHIFVASLRLVHRRDTYLAKMMLTCNHLPTYIKDVSSIEVQTIFIVYVCIPN